MTPGDGGDDAVRGSGIELAAAAPEEVSGSMAWRPELCTTLRAMHGGVMIAMADSIGAGARS
jgi:acyl-coenzyme A thioesterase PaaI-like protein